MKGKVTLDFKTQKKNLFTFSLHDAYGESDSLQKNLAVFVPTFSKCSPGKPCV